MDCRVLIVDDSPTVRAVLRRILGSAPGIQVVGEAVDGREAVEQTLGLRPDAIVMDLEMPGMDGYSAIEQIMARCPTPIVVVTSRVQRDQMGAAFRAIACGAVSVLPKPGIPTQWQELAQLLPETLREVGSRSRPLRTTAAAHGAAPHSQRFRHLAIGASTGGPGAICQLLRELGRGLRLRVAVVQHIAAGFEAGFADWLAQELHLDVRIARDGEDPAPGAVRIAPAGFHLHVDPSGLLRLDGATAPVRGHRPSVDELFLSLASSPAHEVAAVLLSGMGNDGAEGLLELRRAGAFTVVQDEASSAVFGMPKAALESGATDLALAPQEIGRLLARTIVAGR